MAGQVQLAALFSFTDAILYAREGNIKGTILAGLGALPLAGAVAKVAEVGLAAKTTYLYQKVSATGEHLKFGISVNPLTRYTEAQLAGGRLRILASGSRQDILALERDLHSTLPLGPEERQFFYRVIQFLKGLNPYPY